MRSLEEWFKYVESFDHTQETADPVEEERAPAGNGTTAAYLPQTPIAQPEPRSLPRVARNLPSNGAAPAQFRAASAPAYQTPVAPAPAPLRRKPVVPPPPAPITEPIRKETRDELLARLLDPILTLEEAASVLNVCPTTVRRYTNKGLLQHYRTSGNQRRFRLSQVLSFIGDNGGSLETGTLSEGDPAIRRRVRARDRERN